MVATLKGRDVLRITDMSSEEISALLNLSAQLKAGTLNPSCKKVLGLLFYKASTRTRVSFTVAMYQLGGQVIDLNPSVTQVGRGEPLADTARVLDRYLDILAVRTFKQEDLEAFANYSRIPIINALTDLEHPCQILADLQTIQETFQTLRGINLTYVGDGNNVANSLLLGGALMGLNVRVASPANYQPDGEIVASAQAIGEKTGSKILITDDPVMAVKDSQVVYTDVWASMGQESLADARIPVFQPYQVNEQLMSHADKDAIILHCLPAHRGEEITDGAIEGVQSKVWEQAENRMHAQKALMVSLLGLI
ncbi:MAG: ornithine carbamoyltransferase [Microcystis wesenbergii Mw_QC_S_20081001_S30D]|jgi:ornithine carbamoyltransferase|uniref:Ornithine carbamoyltransferase n=1 Tax=Microcystis wesenbergii Mw_QC_S_20081001_S30D TaxID=2486245 RepID=A0A552JMF2_9CHRO|nr:ornithine carbamoyltransferase [Microcystis aeruginosa W11-03]NCR92954.1 ornithine carbamoyltransferase [Microcystis aeruginosa W11-06]TRU94524.1 MAG: ornithine carbamoyltransferase [Microcystis wesenbergii Mw_QC_B_20070930_S4D]TRU96953.1 MAG: ornithine carbamoyltransferase [Microcystis wesenbergii Mw_QC_S_20081001_S30D]TRU97113.1 MAG: ornithine carbamoyltransferase [Microcystis wesenbergii Mw_QC_S_20081001_S30]TRV10742.1 MAG: ornithine carbamoyltransferase [Microcystis wesenbergii Mw_QC_B_